MTVRVVVADDHPIFRAGIVTVLADQPDITVVGEAADGLEAIAAVARLHPDVILMDLRMPRLDGLAAAAQVAAQHPATAVVVLTMDDDEDSVFAALRAGARGYLLKEASGVDVHRAVVAAARGDVVFGAGVAARMLAYFATSRARPQGTPFTALTPREHEVLVLVADGLANQAIATRLLLSEKTVRNRVSDILAKLHARSRAEVVALARDNGLGGKGPTAGPAQPSVTSS